MFIATTNTKTLKLRRSETRTQDTLRSVGAMTRQASGIYKHCIPTGLA
jgi:hypothetical protein